MEIIDEHIKEAECLLIGGQEFDKKERIPFIKKLESLDLLAVPGSGKTTALLANTGSERYLHKIKAWLSICSSE